jgi:hypothetical protein
MNCVEALRGSGHEAGAQAHTETAAMLDALRDENARLREALLDAQGPMYVEFVRHLPVFRCEEES